MAAADWVEAGRDELNRINVFPVPDGDTGTNFALTLRSVADAVRGLPGTSLPAVTRAMAEGCILGARGNSGMLLSQFLLGFKDALGNRERAGPTDVALAMRAGSDQLAASLDEPVEGTILTVARAVAEAGERATALTRRLDDFMRHVLAGAQAALARTPQLLAVLREAGVVDAGGKALVRAIEGIVRLIEGRPVRLAGGRAPAAGPSPAALAAVAHDQDYGFCTQVLVRASPLPAGTMVRTSLRPLGASIVVLASGDLLKVHIHTDTPERVFALARSWGEVREQKADDVRQQHRQLGGSARETATARRRVAIVVDSACDLPDEVVDRHAIIVVPLQVIEGSRVYLDRVELSSAEIYARMRNHGTLFSTSQPAPAAFAQAFGDALAQAEEAVVVTVSGALSGTFGSALAVARTMPQGRVTVVDSRSVSLGMGLLALRAAELAEEGWDGTAIARELDRARHGSGMLFALDTFEHVLRSGRVGRARAWLGTLLGLKPILEIGPDGRVAPVDRVRGRDALVPRMLAHLAARVPGDARQVRFGVVHADAPDMARQMEAALRQRFGPAECLVSPVTAALGVHTGPGAWGVGYQVDAGGNSRAPD